LANKPCLMEVTCAKEFSCATFLFYLGFPAFENISLFLGVGLVYLSSLLTYIFYYIFITYFCSLFYSFFSKAMSRSRCISESGRY